MREVIYVVFTTDIEGHLKIQQRIKKDGYDNPLKIEFIDEINGMYEYSILNMILPKMCINEEIHIVYLSLSLIIEEIIYYFSEHEINSSYFSYHCRLINIL